MTMKQLAVINSVNKAVITKKKSKHKKKTDQFFKSLMPYKVKFNDFEAISRELTALIMR